MATVAKSNACLGCGDTGHWLKDCPKRKGGPSATPSEPRKPSACVNCGGVGHWYKNCPKKKDGTSAPQASPVNASDPGTDPKSTAIKKRPKKKVSVDDLVGPNGILYVYETFPKLLQGRLRGEGHEASDLSKLETLYYNWHKRLKPTMGYTEFVEELEKLGGTKRVRANLREIRLIETGELPIDDPTDNPVDGMMPPPATGTDDANNDDSNDDDVDAARGGDDTGGRPISADDWDTLVGNNAAGSSGGAPTGRGGGDAGNAGTALAGMRSVAPGSHGVDRGERTSQDGPEGQGQPKEGGEEEEEDVTEELLAAAAQQARERQVASGARPTAVGGGVEEGDDWLEDDDLAPPEDVMNEVFVDM